MARRKNTKRIDPRYFLNETTYRDLDEILGTEGDAPALAAALHQFMSDYGMRIENISGEGALPLRKFLAQEIKLGERSDLQRYLEGDRETRARILSTATAEELVRNIESNHIYKVGNDQFIIMPRNFGRQQNRTGVVIGTQEQAAEHEVRY